MERGAGPCTGAADLVGQGRDLVRHARAEAEDRVGGLWLGLRSWPCDLHQHHHGDTGGVEQKNGAEEPPDPCPLPLDGSRRFRRDVIGDPVDPLDLVDDPRGSFAEELVGERVVIGSHAVDRGHRPERAGKVIGPPVAHHAHGAHGQDRDESLPDLVIKAMAADLVDIDRVGLAQDLELFAGDLAGASGWRGRGRGRDGGR